MKPIPDAPAGTPSGESAAAALPSPTPGNGAAPPAGQTPAEGQTAEAATPSPSTDPTPVPDPEELAGYTDEELKAAYRSLPEAVRKANNKIFTETKMKLADAGRLGEALLKDPVNFAKQLVEKLGAEAVMGKPAAGQPTPAEAAKEISDQLAPFFAGDVNSAKAFATILESAISKVTAPIQQAHVQAVEQALKAESQSVLNTFMKDFPDAARHESAMGEFFQMFPPGENVDGRMALEAAYAYATRNERAAASARESVDRLNAAAAAQAGNGTPAAGAAPIAPAPPRALPTVSEAVAAALQGIRWQ